MPLIISVEPIMADMRNSFRNKSKVHKTVKNENFDYSEGHKFLCKKNFEYSAFRNEDFLVSFVFIKAMYSDFRVEVFKISKKDQKYGVKYSLTDFYEGCRQRGSVKKGFRGVWRHTEE